MGRKVRIFTVLTVVAAALAVTGTASAAPVNDSISTPIDIPKSPLPFTSKLSTVGASTEATEPIPPCATVNGFGATVWYRWTASPTDAKLTIDTYGSTSGTDPFDTVLAAYHQVSGQWVNDVCNDDDDAGRRQSVIRFVARANTTYLVQVAGSKGRDGFTHETGDLVFSVSRRPANDDAADASEIKDLPFTDLTSNVGATDEDVRPADCLQPHSSIWYRFSTTSKKALVADTFGSSFDTIVAIYSGTPSTNASLVCNDNDEAGLGGPQSRVVWSADPGVYWIQVGGRDIAAAGSTLVFHLSELPANDAFGSAAGLGAVPAQTTTQTNGAHRETGEPVPSCTAPGAVVGATVWYTFTPTASGPVTMTTLGSDFDTILALYAGANLASLSEVPNGCNDDFTRVIGGSPPFSFPQSKVSFVATGGTKYSIQAGTTSTASGSAGFVGGKLVLNLPQANDDPDFPVAITVMAAADLPLAAGSPLGAGSDPGEAAATCATPAGTPAGNSLWYKFIAPAPGTYTVQTNGSLIGDPAVPYDTVLAVYNANASGYPVGAQVACNDDAGGALSVNSRAQFFASAVNAPFLVRLAAKNNLVGDLKLRLTASPSCDAMTKPCDVTTPGDQDVTTPAFQHEVSQDEVMSATLDAGEYQPPASCVAAGSVGNTAWFQYTTPDTLTPTAPLTIVAHTFGSAYNTAIVVYKDSQTPVLPAGRIACNDDSSGTQQSRVTFTASTPKTTFYFQVGGVSGAFGKLVFHAVPENDDVTLARTVPLPIPSAPAYVAKQSTKGAWADPDTEPAPKSALGRSCPAPGATVWYRLQLPAGVDLSFTVDTAGSLNTKTPGPLDTIVGIWRDNGANPMTPIDCNDDDGVTPGVPGTSPVKTSKVTFTATGNVLYLIQVGGKGDDDGVPEHAAQGNLILRVTPAAPVNDAPADAVRVTATGDSSAVPTLIRYTDARATFGATFAGEKTPTCGAGHAATVWYVYTPGARVKIDVDTGGSNHLSFVQVYQTQTTLVPTLTALENGCSTDAATAGQAHVAFTSTPGVTYYFQVGSIGGVLGGKTQFRLITRPTI